MSWFQALQVYLLSLFEKLRDPFVLLWFMSVHLEATSSRCSQSCERSVASSGVQRRSGSEEASGWRPHQWVDRDFLSLWCDFKTFKYEWTANSRAWRIIIARSFRKNDLGRRFRSKVMFTPQRHFKPKRKWNWHLAHVQPTRPVSFAKPRCCSAAGTLFSVGSASSQIPHRRAAFIGFPLKRNRPFRGQIWFATPRVACSLDLITRVLILLFSRWC